MKKILLFIIIFITYISNTYAYIDYRHDIKTDYFSSEIFMNNHINEKYKIDKKVEIIHNKIKDYKFDDKIDYIESIKEKTLNYLFSNHIQKDNVIYYRLVYYYNKIDSLKYKTEKNYKTDNITKNYNSTNYYSNNYNCSFYYNWRKYYLANYQNKYFRENNDKIKYYCKNWIIYKETQENYYSNYYNYNSSYYNNSTTTSYYYNYSDSCNLSVFWYDYTIYDWNYRTVFKEYSDKIEYRKYKCDNWDLKLVSTWYKNINNKKCSLNLDWTYYILDSWDSKNVIKSYYLNWIQRYYNVEYYCDNWNIITR